MSDPQQNAAARPNNAKRKRMMTLLVVVIVIAAIAYGLYYFLVARFRESTDDAYVNGNVVQITPQVTGTVVAVNADDTQTGEGRRAAGGARPGRRAGRAAAGRGQPGADRAPGARPVRQRRPVSRAGRAARVGPVEGAGRPAPPPRGGTDGRRLAGRNLARARRREGRAGLARRRPAAARLEPRADREHDDRRSPERDGRRRQGARRLPGERAQHAARAGHGLRRQALGAGRPARRSRARR